MYFQNFNLNYKNSLKNIFIATLNTMPAKTAGKKRRAADSFKEPVSCGTVKKVKKEKIRKADNPGISCGHKIRKAITDSKFDPKTLGVNKTIALEGKGPYPTFIRPTPGDAYRAQHELITLHGDYEPGASGLVLDSLVRTILSQNTTDITSARAFKQLKAAYPTYEDIENAPIKGIIEQIHCCGLADKRAAAIKGILSTLREERDELSLEYVHDMSNEEVKKELTRFKGVGPKTAACVLMFCLKRPEFPVDTHVWRITKALGWVPQSASREKAYEHLNRRIPDDVKFSLHVLLVEHGKVCKKCAKNGKPRRTVLGPCPLSFTRVSMEREMMLNNDFKTGKMEEEQEDAVDSKEL
jgi:endonuclease-3